MKSYKIFTNHIIIINDNDSVTVYKKMSNAKEGFRKLCDAQSLVYDNAWTTRQFGAKVSAAIEEQKTDNYYLEVVGYCFGVDEKGSYSIFESTPSAKSALREIADEIGFEYEEGWNTRSFGSKIVNLK